MSHRELSSNIAPLAWTSIGQSRYTLYWQTKLSVGYIHVVSSCVYLVVNDTHLACIQMSLLHYFNIWMQKGGRGGWKARTDMLLTTLNVFPSPVLTLSNMNDQPVNPSNYLHHDMVCLVAFLPTKFKCSPEIFVWWWELYSRPRVQTRKLYKLMAERG